LMAVAQLKCCLLHCREVEVLGFHAVVRAGVLV
jgi:hypothetical protein